MLLSFDPKTSVWDFVVTFDPRPEFDDEVNNSVERITSYEWYRESFSEK